LTDHIREHLRTCRCLIFDLTEAMRRAVAPLASMMQPQAPGMFDALVQRLAEASADAQRFSR
jgi:hypothetical protein